MKRYSANPTYMMSLSQAVISEIPDFPGRLYINFSSG
jgi:hypothetical protein